MKLAKRNILETLLETTIKASGYAAILIVALIFAFLLRYALPVMEHQNLWDMLKGRNWLPISDPPTFGILPLIVGSLYVTFGAAVLALPIGLAAAIYLSEVASPRLRELLKPVIELLAAVPSVVFGFVALMVIAPLLKTWATNLSESIPGPAFLKNALDMPTGMSAFTAAIVLAFMALPIIISISDDAMQAVPRNYRDGSMALGATRWQTIRTVIVPAARSGIVAAMMLGIGRVIGETMTVLMVAGNSRGMPEFFTGFFRPVRTMTATIAGEMGETAQFTDHFYTLFMVGAVLLTITFFINLVADWVINKTKLEEHTS